MISTETMDWWRVWVVVSAIRNRIAFQTTAYEQRYGTEALREVMLTKKMMASGAIATVERMPRVSLLIIRG